MPIPASLRDRSPIDQDWIRRYCDEFQKILAIYPQESVMRAAIERRIECCQDLVEAWQLRNVPLEHRHAENLR